MGQWGYVCENLEFTSSIVGDLVRGMVPLVPFVFFDRLLTSCFSERSVFVLHHQSH